MKALAFGLAAALTVATPAAAQEASRGAVLFEACRSCHTLDPKEAGLPGPFLGRLNGRRVGTAEGFDYSPALVAARDQGLVWDAPRLSAFLADPDAVFPGTWMSPPGRMSEADRQALAAYLMRND